MWNPGSNTNQSIYKNRLTDIENKLMVAAASSLQVDSLLSEPPGKPDINTNMSQLQTLFLFTPEHTSVCLRTKISSHMNTV